MSVSRVVRAVVSAACVLAAGAGCDSPDESPAPEPSAADIEATTMRGAFLQPAEIGPAWAPTEEAPDQVELVSFCGGTTKGPAVPPGATVVASAAIDQGQAGVQTLHQYALVYPDAAGATAGAALLRAVADGCRPDVSAPATVTDDRNEPAYTESARVQPLTEGRWSGFVVLRHKKYEPKHPGTADTAVAVLSNRNVVLVDTYAIYRLSATGPAPAFDADWKKLVGSVVQRVG